MFINTNKILITDKILSKCECEEIKKYILTNEERIKNLGPDVYPGTDDDSLTGRYPYFNYLNAPEVGDILIPKLIRIFEEMNLRLPISVQCWANTFRLGQGIKYHRHGPPNFSFLCGNIFIAGPTKPGTTYEIDGNLVDIENDSGTLTMFDSHVGHLVKPNNSDEIRISIAMDILEQCNDLDLDWKRYFVIDSYE